MKEAKELVNYINSQDIYEKFDNIFHSLKKLKNEEKESVLSFLNGKISLISKSIEDIVLKGDEEEFSGLLVSLWLEIRLEWNRYNCQMQYQTSLNSFAEQELMARGSCISILIDCIEKYLSTQDLYWIVKIAVNPIEAVSYRTKQNDKLVEKTSSYGKLSNHIINNQLEMLEQLSKSRASNKIIQKFKKQINKNVNSIAKSGFLELSDLSDLIENILVKKMKDHNLQFNVINNISSSVSLGIPPEVVEVIQLILDEYVGDLLNQSIERTIEQRLNKSDFVNFRWQIEYHNECFIFTFIDDGLGCNDWKLKKDMINDLSLDATVSNTPQKGSSLMLGIRHMNVNEYIVFESIGKDGANKYAINSSNIVKLFDNKDISIGEDGVEVSKIVLPNDIVDKNNLNSKIIFKDDLEKLWILNCNKILGSLLLRPFPGAVISEDEIFSGIIERESDILRILNTSIVSKDLHEDNSVLKILL